MSTTRSAAGPVAGAVTSTGRRRTGAALFVIATAQLMVVLDTAIVNVALPHIQHALGFSGTGLEWVVNAYALTFGGLLLLGGRAGDLFGRPCHVHRGARAVHRRLAGRRPGHLPELAAGRPRGAGRGRGGRRADRPGPDHDDVSRGPAAQPGVRCLRGDGRGGRHGRPYRGRPADQLRLLALGAVRQRADRCPRDAAGASDPGGVAAPARPPRPGPE